MTVRGPLTGFQSKYVDHLWALVVVTLVSSGSEPPNPVIVSHRADGYEPLKTLNVCRAFFAVTKKGRGNAPYTMELLFHHMFTQRFTFQDNTIRSMHDPIQNRLRQCRVNE